MAWGGSGGRGRTRAHAHTHTHMHDYDRIALICGRDHLSSIKQLPPILKVHWQCQVYKETLLSLHWVPWGSSQGKNESKISPLPPPTRIAQETVGKAAATTLCK